MYRVWFCKANFNKMPVERQVKVNIEAGHGDRSGWGPVMPPILSSGPSDCSATQNTSAQVIDR